jgi:hypothetical protein
VISGEATVTEYLNRLGNAIVDRSPEELIGAVAVALTISLAMAGLYCIGRRKITENLLPMIVLMIVANLVSMAVGMGYFRVAHKKMGYVERELQRRPPGGPGGSAEVAARWIFRTADSDHDGRLSEEEASLAAADFVRWMDPSGQGSINLRSLDTALQATMFHGRDPYHFPRPFGNRGPWNPEISGPGSRSNRLPPRMGPPSDDQLPDTNQSKNPSEERIRLEPENTHISD